jgi:hypothetical protein
MWHCTTKGCTDVFRFLQALELLRLFGEVACDDVLQHVSNLPRLQELILVDGMFTLASFQQLPQSLTHLGIGWAADTINTTNKDLTASTAPSLCALTILREFEVHGGASRGFFLQHSSSHVEQHSSPVFGGFPRPPGTASSIVCCWGVSGPRVPLACM